MTTLFTDSHDGTFPHETMMGQNAMRITEVLEGHPSVIWPSWYYKNGVMVERKGVKGTV